MAEFRVFEILFGVFVAIFLFRDLLLKHFLLRRLREHHADVWKQMGSPRTIGIYESHWMLAGITRDFDLCASLGADEASRTTRAQIYRYRIFSAVEAAAVLAMMAAIYADI